ncbi:hypothetical protein BGP_5822 [Beggiatoa sp. PS]|nr:hypothetical protein BGP_5822 [Beggiatoa sp. PS]
MMTILEKVKQLEQYLIFSNLTVDPVLDMSINKLLARESTRMNELKTRLLKQVTMFEQTYSMVSNEFYTRYEKREMGDDMDFVEWASTVEMLTNVDNRLKILQTGSNS